MRLLVCGTRDWPGTWEEIGIHLPESDVEATIIHGACSRKARRQGVLCEVSVDMLADFCARGLGHIVERFPADWSKGKVAGMARNARMLAEGKPDRGLAFGPLWRMWTREDGSFGVVAAGWKHTGTGDMVNRMLRAGLQVRWIAAPGASPVDLQQMPPHPEDAR